MKNNQTNQRPVKLSLEHSRRDNAILRDINSNSSTLPETLIDSYLTAQYQIWIDAALVTLKIGCPSTSLAILMQATDTQNAVYVTACNPGSQIIPADMNQPAMTQLYEKLASCSNYIYRGASIDPIKEWPPEESLLALGVDLPSAKSVGSEFGQNAIIWIDSAAVPYLVLLR